MASASLPPPWASRSSGSSAFLRCSSGPPARLPRELSLANRAMLGPPEQGAMVDVGHETTTGPVPGDGVGWTSSVAVRGSDLLTDAGKRRGGHGMCARNGIVRVMARDRYRATRLV
jgi:hypothetical protein